MTEFGKYLRKLRIDHNEVLYDMAKKLEVSSAFLSSVENGKKSAPLNWVPQIIKIYSLTENQGIELQELADKTAKQIQIDLKNTGAERRNLALTFARRFDSIDRDQIDGMLKILGSKTGE